MKKLLSAVLSLSIVFSSVSPSLAQMAPTAGRQLVKGVVRGGEKAVSPSAARQTLTNAVQKRAGRLPAQMRGTAAVERGTALRPTAKTPAAQPASVGSSSLSTEQVASISAAVEQTVQQQVSLTGRDIRQAIKAGRTEGMAARILTHSNPQVREGMLRNEFVTVALAGDATPEQIEQALSFYRKDVMASSEAFAQLPQGEAAGYLAILQDKKHVSYPAVAQSLQALSSAAALGLLGSRSDAGALMGFYKKASQSALKDTAARVAARGMLRQGAYKELNELAALAQGQGSFWNDLAALAQERNWPVQIQPASAASAQTPSKELGLFLQAGCFANRFNADASRRATEEWLALGKQRASVSKQQASSERAARLAAPIAVELPKLQFAAADLTADILPAVSLQEAAAPAEQAAQSTVSFFGRSTASADGAVYGGVPVFAIGNMLKKGFNWLRGKWGKKQPAAAPEEPGLHDDSEIQEVFSPLLRSPEAPASADEVLGASEMSLIPIAEKGFKLTLVDEQGVERILPVNLETSNRFRVKGYNRIAFTAHSDFTNNYVAELRNQDKDPKRMAHFYMRIQANQVGALVDLAPLAGVEKFYLKLENLPNVQYKSVSLPVFDLVTGKELPLEVSLPVKNYVKNAKMVVMENGALGLVKPGASQAQALTGLYVRLPKNQITNFVKVLQYSPTPFNVSVHPTQNRADLIMRDASLTNVSLGKTMGPVVNNALGMKVNEANSMMFTINYILPGLASLLTPILKKYGEKKLMALSLAMSSAAGILASAGGFYGFVENLTLGPVSKGLFITALFLMSGSSILKQLVSNMLIRANRGEVILNQAKQAVKKSETEFTAEEKQGFAQMGLRLKEFFTKKSDVSLKDIVLYNLSFVYKNAGTLAFLASPYIINFGLTQLTGHDFGLDYSVSFPLYAAYSSVVAWKVWRAKLRDAYSAKNLEQSQKNLQVSLTSGSRVLATTEKLSSSQIDDIARTFKDALDALVFADMKLNPGQKKADLYAKTKADFLARLEARLIGEHQMDPQGARVLISKIKSSIKVQENTLGNMAKMLKAPGVAALSTAMTLATVHEFVISSAFSSTMKGLISEGELANFLIACSLYIPLLGGRLGGNLVSRRISADSMYILCSSLSALGTGIMIGAGDSIPLTITGAAVASLGVGNFFTQMYDYIMTLYPKQNREISSILALTMALGGLGAIPAGYLASANNDVPSLIYAAAALGLSLVLTPGMMKHSTLVKGMRYEAKRLWKGIQKLFKRGGDKNGGAAGNAAGTSLDDAVPAQ